MIRLEAFSFQYYGADHPALNNISLRIRKGEFVLLCGASGCGKTTLLRMLKPSMQPMGTCSGELLFEGKPLETLSAREQTARIGYVAQSPETQLVTDKVWHELAFAMESLGYETKTIRARTAEMAEFFGIGGWYYRNVSELSGGQKQLLNLASVMTLCPDILVLDEPTSQLDPVAAGEFLRMLEKINRELGTAVLLSEHRLEEAIPMADRIAVMEEGQIISDGNPKETGRQLYCIKSGMFQAMTSAMQVWAELTEDPDEDCPLTVREGRNWLENYCKEHPSAAGRKTDRKESAGPVRNTVLRMEEVSFRYHKEAPDVVKNLSMSIYQGELAVILGGNGAGKSTAMKLMAGILEPVHGEIECNISKAMLPQDSKCMFAQKTVRKELEEMENDPVIVGEMLGTMHLEHLPEQHPFDISGGEQQRLGLAKILLNKPELLLLDEPTKGLDAQKKEQFAKILKKLCKEGKTVVMISHDVEFAAAHADRCLMFFDGMVTSEDCPHNFFSGNSFYTTAVSRMTRGYLDHCVTLEDVRNKFGKTGIPEQKDDLSAANPESMQAPAASGIEYRKEDQKEARKENPKTTGQAEKHTNTVRKLLVLLSGAGVIYFAARIITGTDLTVLISGNRISDAAVLSMPLYVGLMLSCTVLILCIGKKRTGNGSGKTITAGNRMGKGKPGARELTLVASMTAFAVAGRAAFFAIPGFTPVFGIVILSGAALGARNGFIVGALSMLLSNFLFGQGPWTPWQMAAMGILGSLGSILFQKTVLPDGKLNMSAWSALITTAVYGGIMNFATAVISGAAGNAKQLLAYYVAGLPVDLVHGAATFVFLWFLAEPILFELNRVIRKYNLSGREPVL